MKRATWMVLSALVGLGGCGGSQHTESPQPAAACPSSAEAVAALDAQQTSTDQSITDWQYGPVRCADGYASIVRSPPARLADQMEDMRAILEFRDGHWVLVDAGTDGCGDAPQAIWASLGCE